MYYSKTYIIICNNKINTTYNLKLNGNDNIYNTKTCTT